MSQSFEKTVRRICNGIALAAAAANLFLKWVLPLRIFRSEEATSVAVIGGDTPRLVAGTNVRGAKKWGILAGLFAGCMVIAFLLQKLSHRG